MRIVASDFDGTLYRNGRVSEEEKTAISNWRKNGNLFGIITGRNYRFLREDLDPLNVEYDFIISTNGAMIRDEKGNVLKSFEGDIAYAEDILNMVTEKNAIWFEVMYLDSLKREVIELRDPNSELKINKEILHETDYFHQLSCTLPSIESGLKLTDEINARFNGKLSAYSLIYGKNSNIDIVKYNISKASALYEYAKLKNIEPENIITVGDNFNDIPMIKEFNGYIMASAIEEVRKLADKTCETLCDILR